MILTVLLGAPGAGKGTVAARVAAPLGAHHVSSGAMLRVAVKDGTPAGKVAQACMDRGELVPDAVLADMIDEQLAKAPREARFLLDGYPRNVPQAECLERLAARHGAVVDCAVSLDVPPDVVLDRLGGRRVCPACGANYHVRTLPPRRAGLCDACGAALVTRDDDRPETIRKRLEVYERQTAPLTVWYAQAGKLRRVEGAGPAETVADAVLRLLAGT